MGRDRTRLIRRGALGGARAATVLVPAAFITVFFLYPAATILWRGLGAEGLAPVLDLADSSRTRDVVWFTVWQAAVKRPGSIRLQELCQQRRQQDGR